MKKVLSIFALLTLVMGAWAYDWSDGKTVYFDNAVTQWENVYVIIGHGSYSRAYQMSKVENTNNLYYYTMSPKWGGYDKFVIASTIGSATTGGGGTSISNAYATCTSRIQSVSQNISANTLITPTGTSSAYGRNITTSFNLDDYYTSPVPVSGDLLAVLKGEKIMCYICNEWGSSKMYVGTSGKANNVMNGASSSTKATFTNGSKTAELNYAVLTYAEGRYYISNSSTWDGVQMADGTKTQAGYAYNLSNKTTFGGSSSNHIDVLTIDVWEHGELVQNTVPTWSTQTASINAGESSCVIEATVAAKSVALLDNTIKYYLEENNTYTQIKLNELEELAAGEYTIWAIATDGKISVRSADAATLTIGASSSTAHTITYTAQAAGWTYGAKPTQVEDGEDLVFVVHTSAGYQVTVKNGEATLTPAADGKTYTVSQVTEDININVTAEKQTYHITYTAEAAGWTYGAKDETKIFEETVNFVVNPTDGYKVTVTSEQVSINKNGNNYSFTMPANDVTVQVSAEEIVPVKLGYWNNTYDWNPVYIKLDGGSQGSNGNWPGVEVAASYYSNGKGVYVVTFDEGAHTSGYWNKGNGSNQVQINVNNHQGKCYNPATGNWEQFPEENWEVTISAENGTVSDAKKYVNATEVTVTAEPTAGYIFDRWEADGGVIIITSTETAATITASAIGTLKAIYKADVTKFAINFSAEGGTATATVGGNAITTGTQYTVGESVDVTFSAAATGSNTFYGWYDGENNKVSEDNPYTVSGITENYTIKALYAGQFFLKHPWNGDGWDVKELTFDPTTSLYFIYAYYGDNGFNYGNTNSSLTWNGGAQNNALVGAPAKHDWCYITTNTSGAITVAKVTETHTLTVVGEHVTPNIQVHGAAATAAHHMESAIFSATIADGYKFAGWYADAELQNLLSDAAEYTVESVTEDVVLYVKTVVEPQYTITIKNNVNTTETTMQVGETAKALTAAEIALYAFTGWTVEGDAVVANLTAASTTITAIGTATVTANYELKHYYIKHNTWKSDGSWDWKEATEYENGTFSLIAKYGQSGCNWTDKADYSGSKYISDPTVVGDPAKGDCCRFTLDPTAGTITITKIDDTPADPLETVFYLSGDFNSWSTTANCFKRENADDNIAYTTITLNSTDDIEFKIFEYNTCESKFYGNEGTIDEKTTFSTWWSVSTSKNNCKLSPIVAGTYTFALNLSEKRIYVDFPKTEVAISGVYEYGTYYGATALTVPDGVEAYYVSGISGEELIMESINVIPAETGVILYAAGGGNYEFRQTTTAEDYSAVNWLKGSLEATTINNSLTHYILSATTQENIGLYYPKGTGNNNGVGAFTNGANKAYLEVPAASPVSARAFLFRRPGVTTALENKEVKNESVKMLQNGQLMIIRGAHRYNAMGQLIQ